MAYITVNDIAYQALIESQPLDDIHAQITDGLSDGTKDFNMNDGTLAQLDVDDININGNTILSSGASTLAITPTSGQKLILDGHWGFDGVAFTAETDANTTFTAYASKNITIESVAFDGGVLSIASGRVDVGGTGAGGNLLFLEAADGVADNDWVSEISNIESTAGRNYGISLKAGSNASDANMRCVDVSSGLLFEVRGDGVIKIPGDSIFDSGGAAVINFDGSQNVSIPNGALSVTGGGISASLSSAGAIVSNEVNNTENTNAASHARLMANSGGASGGDAFVRMTNNGTTEWSLGLDNSDSDSFVVSNNSTLGTNNYLEITTGGIVVLPGAALHFGDSDAIISYSAGIIAFSEEKISINEAAPDCDAGGLTLNHGAADGLALTIKNSDVAHGFTDFFEADTYAAFEKTQDNFGGLEISGISDDGTGGVGLRAVGYVADPDDTSATSSVGIVSISAYDSDGGTGRSVPAAADNIVTFDGGAVTQHIFKGDGDIYTNTDQTGGLAGTYDSEDDIMLVNAARYEVKGYKEHNLQKHAKRLNELGIMENGFLSHRKITDLQLGAIGQLYNIIKGIADKFDINESELIQFAKNYG